MKIILEKSKIGNAEMFIRHCGYGKIFDRRTGETSYARRFGPQLYPRFHAYIEEKGDEVRINLHLDQRATRYEGVTAHAGEYDGEVVEREGERIRASAGK